MKLPILGLILLTTCFVCCSDSDDKIIKTSNCNISSYGSRYNFTYDNLNRLTKFDDINEVMYDFTYQDNLTIKVIDTDKSSKRTSQITVYLNQDKRISKVEREISGVYLRLYYNNDGTLKSIADDDDSWDSIYCSYDPDKRNITGVKAYSNKKLIGEYSIKYDNNTTPFSNDGLKAWIGTDLDGWENVIRLFSKNNLLSINDKEVYRYTFNQQGYPDTEREFNNGNLISDSQLQYECK